MTEVVQTSVPPDGLIPYGDRIAELAETGQGAAVVVLRSDGSEQQITWQELHERSTHLAYVLRDHEVTISSRVGVKLPNGLEFVLAVLAAWKLGATVVPIRWDLPQWEFDRVAAVIDATLILDESNRDIFDEAADTVDEPGWAAELPTVWSEHASGVLSGGSTGTPKVILRTAPGLFDPTQSSRNRLIQDYGHDSDHEVVFVLGAMYHANGLNAFGNLLAGARLVIFERFDASRAVRAIAEHRVTGFVITTLMLQRMARTPEFASADFSSLQWVLQGAAPLPDWLARVWIERIGPERFFVCYGATEIVGFTVARGDAYLDHAGTVGAAASGVEIRILDGDGHDLPAGEVGEIYLRSEGGARTRYLGADSLPRTPDGYSSLGDLGWLDEDGYLYIADRRVDMIVTGGANVYPAEVEAAISEHPDVGDVAVIGLQDAEWGRRVHAVVELRDPAVIVTADDVIAWAADRLARYKVPKSVEFLDRLPRTTAMKINRSALVAERDHAADADQPATATHTASR